MGRSYFDRCIVGVIHDARIAGAVRSRLAGRAILVLVTVVEDFLRHLLFREGVLPWRQHVPVAMGMYEVVFTQNTDEATANFRAPEYQIQFRNPRYYVVPGIEFVFVDKVEFLIDHPMDFIGNAGTENDVPIGDVLAHLLVVEQNGFR
jgi:hypothetical protein